MNPTRVMIVDDSVVIRRILRAALSTDSSIQVVGTASNGRIAVSLLDSMSPDLITLDVEMPEMNGLDALREIRRRSPSVPVIMFSSLTERGAATTLDALALGASDYVTKPNHMTDSTLAIECIREQLIPKIRALRRGEKQPSRSQVNGLRHSSSENFPNRFGLTTAPVSVVAIGTSTGGPNALAQVLPAIPKNFPVPILVVQHMPPTFTRFLAERLANSSAISVAEGCDGETVTRGKACIAPGDFHMTVVRENGQVRLRMNHNAPENSCRPAVDVLFRSVAKAYGRGTLAVVLTGMGQDGTRGSSAICEAGGRILVQDEATSVVWGMPGFVAQAGLADRILPLGQITAEIIKRVNDAVAVAE